MPTSARRRRTDCLVDTSAAVAYLVVDHEDYQSVSTVLANRRRGLAGHAAFETFSVLTRLPTPVRRSPRTVSLLLTDSFPATRFLSPEGAAALLGRLPQMGIGGGAVYDALVGAAAAEHGLPLVSRDRRAADVYRALGVEVELIAG